MANIYLSGPADRGQTWIHLNSRVVIQTSAGGFIFKPRAAFSKFPQRSWKRSVSSLLRIQKQILRPLHPHLEPRLTATLVPKSGERMKFLERLLEPFTAAIIAVFSILTNCFFKPRHGAFVITGMRVFLHSLIFFYLSINFLHERCRRICRLTFVSRIVWVYSFREGCKILRRGYASSSFTRLQLWTSRQTGEPCPI